MPVYTVDQLLAIQQSDLVKTPEFLYPDIKSVHRDDEFQTVGAGHHHSHHGHHGHSHHQGGHHHGGHHGHGHEAEREVKAVSNELERAEEAEDEEDDDESHLKDLTSRYFLQRENLYKKLHMGGGAAGGEFNSIKTSTVNGSAGSSTGGVTIAGRVVEAGFTSESVGDDNAADDDDGWISVGPKHPQSHHSNTGGWYHGGHHHHHHRGGRRSFGADSATGERKNFHRRNSVEPNSKEEEAIEEEK